jgi:hypothetical protein
MARWCKDTFYQCSGSGSKGSVNFWASGSSPDPLVRGMDPDSDPDLDPDPDSDRDP